MENRHIPPNVKGNSCIIHFFFYKIQCQCKNYEGPSLSILASKVTPFTPLINPLHILYLLFCPLLSRFILCKFNVHSTSARHPLYISSALPLHSLSTPLRPLTPCSPIMHPTEISFIFPVQPIVSPVLSLYFIYPPMCIPKYLLINQFPVNSTISPVNPLFIFGTLL